MDLFSERSLTPGFRFHPTDEELVCFYLKRKVSGKVFSFEPISVVDIYKYEPWDLPDKSKLKTKDLEWYFFGALDKKNGNSSRTNRVTEKGYWKTTGKDREVRHSSRTAGMKKTLVYHSGRAPRGTRTNWVMHEYRLVNGELEEKKCMFQDSFVLCRIFQKSGPGPKNGEKYGAPFVEEEWEDDEELLSVPGQDAARNEELAHEDGYGEVEDSKQNDGGVSSETAQFLSSFYHGETSVDVNQLDDFVEDDSQKLWDELISEMNTEDFQSNGNLNTKDVDYLVNEPDTNAPNNLSFDEGLFLEETDDLSNRIKDNDFDLLEDYLAFFGADGDNPFMSFDPSEIIGGEELVLEQGSPDDNVKFEQLVDGEVDHASMGNQEVSDASSSEKKLEISPTKTDTKFSFVQSVSDVLGSLPAPPAFASEIPSKEAALQLRSLVRPSSAAHATAGMSRVRKILRSGDISSAILFPLAGVLLLKPESLVSPCFLFFILFWVLILSLGFKVVCACICHS